MTVYDFDNTIYNGESTFDYFLYCMCRHPRLVRWFFTMLHGLVRYKLCLVSRQELLTLAEKCMRSMLAACPDYKELAETFWDKNMRKIKKFYLERRQEDDVIMTASFDFLIEPCMRRLGLTNVCCSSADLQTGKITRLCFRENKPACFAQLFPDAAADTFYTDSLNDRPMMLFAENSFLVKGERVIPIDKTSL